MSKYERFVNWLDTYKNVAFDLLRMYLGVGLFVRGILFFYDASAFTALIDPNASSWITSPFVFGLVAVVHLAGGLMLAVGFWTRIAALLQIPIVSGAVFLSFFQGGLFSADQSFEFSALVLFLLVLVFVYGSGHWSVDHYLQRSLRVFAGLDAWAETHRHVAFDLLRIYLGIGLFVRGILFIADSRAFIDLVGTSQSALITSFVLIHYVALSHLLGGAMMASGLFTRIAALLQIPILLGAVFVVHFQGGLLESSQSLEFSVLVLFMLVLIFLYGSGRWSAEHFFFVRAKDNEPALAERGERADEILNRPAPERVTTPAVGASAADIEVLTQPQKKTLTCPLTGTCSLVESDAPREHPWIRTRIKYSTLGALYFLGGVTGPPKEVIFHCGKCGQTIEKSRDPEDLKHFRYRSEV